VDIPGSRDLQGFREPAERVAPAGRLVFQVTPASLDLPGLLAHPDFREQVELPDSLDILASRDSRVPPGCPEQEELQALVVSRGTQDTADDPASAGCPEQEELQAPVELAGQVAYQGTPDSVGSRGHLDFLVLQAPQGPLVPVGRRDIVVILLLLCIETTQMRSIW